MEVVALLGLAGAGLLLARSTGPTPQAAAANPIARKEIKVKEPFEDQKTSLRGRTAELDLNYKGLMGTNTPLPVYPQQPISAATPDVMMNPGGKEKKPKSNKAKAKPKKRKRLNAIDEINARANKRIAGL
jgi:hypothetical protein